MVKGFLFNGLHAGIKTTGEKDLGLIFSEVPAVAAGVFTKNWIKAAPVLVTQKQLEKHVCQAVLVNSGNANACTGTKGILDAQELIKQLAHYLRIPAGAVSMSSTGVIGEPLPTGTIADHLHMLCKSLQPDKIDDFAQAIMTTDTVHKVVTAQKTIAGKKVRVAGIVKGAGMINPSMATMLGFILTDAAIRPQSIQALVAEGADQSFNRITVDSDTSTNDTVLLLANGAAGVRSRDRGLLACPGVIVVVQGPGRTAEVAIRAGLQPGRIRGHVARATITPRGRGRVLHRASPRNVTATADAQADEFHIIQQVCPLRIVLAIA